MQVLFKKVLFEIEPRSVTPLMMAAKVGSTRLVKTLLEYGADPTCVTKAGDTALSIGAKVCTRNTEHGPYVLYYSALQPTVSDDSR